MANATKNETARTLLMKSGNIVASTATTAPHHKSVDLQASRNAAIAARRASFATADNSAAGKKTAQ